MRTLSHNETLLLSGGRKPTGDEIAASVEEYGFLFGVVGGPISAVYAFLRSTGGTIVVNGVQQGLSFTNMFYAGVGMAFFAGLIFGVGKAYYDAAYSEQSVGV